MIKEFKAFLFRGNIVELAVAFVMGLAFAAVVNSLVNNLVMPIVAAIIGKPDFRNLTFTIHRSVFHYGAFLTDLIQFVAIGAAVFCFIVKPVQMMLAQSRREPIEEGMPDEERRHQDCWPHSARATSRPVHRVRAGTVLGSCSFEGLDSHAFEQTPGRTRKLLA